MYLSTHSNQQDTLKISTLSIQFGSPEQIIRSLILKNTHETLALAYKIKTNNLQAIQATPNVGLIRADTTISLRIKAIPKPFQAKLLISYGLAGERPGQFNQIWTSLPKNSIKNKQVRVWRVDESQNKAPTSRTLLQPPKQSNHSQRSQSQDRSRRIYLSKPSGQMSESQIANTLFDLQQKLSQQQIANSKIKQQLEITQQKLKQINQERLQIKVNKSIGIICQDYHTSFTTLLLYGLGLFVFGYVLAKWEM